MGIDSKDIYTYMVWIILLALNNGEKIPTVGMLYKLQIINLSEFTKNIYF